MSIKQIDSNQIEELADALVVVLTAERKKKGPFEFLKVVVANKNLGSWLKMKVLAQKPQLSAGIEMLTLDEELERILKESYKESCKPEEVEIVSGEKYPALILNILMTDGRTEFAPFRKYIKEPKEEKDVAIGPLTIDSQREARRAVQLANRLGQLIADYEATGYLEELKKKKDASDIFKGEWALVEALKDVQSLRKVFDSVKNTAPKEPHEKIILFGHTTLTDLQKRILEWVAETHEVIWYCPKAEMIPKKGVEVSIVGAPGIRREVEMVHQKILEEILIWNEDGTPKMEEEKNGKKKPVKKEGINFSDIAVLVADMPKYRPMIESVFEGRGQIPFGLIDVTSSDYSTYLDGFLALMDIARYGLNRKRLFAVLDNSCVQRRLNITQESVDKWREYAKKLGAYDGFEQADSDEGNVSGRFEWSWALTRLRLGLVAEKIKVDNVDMELEALDDGEAEKFSEVVETLHQRLSRLDNVQARCSSKDEKEWPDTWAGRLHDIIDEFLAAEKDDSLETDVRVSIVRTLNSLDVIEGEQGYCLPVAFVESAVGGMECANGGFLRHGVTIGGLRSLAHVPFKHVFVMGLSAAFPGKNDHSTLDVRNELEENERKKDRGEILHTDQERANFEAAVSSAREKLVLSYSRLDLQTDEKLYPSSLVYEVPIAKKKEYPLVSPSTAKNLNGKNENKPIEIANQENSSQALNQSGEENSSNVAPAEAVFEVKEPSAKDMAAFVRDPFNGWFERRFGIAQEKSRTTDIQETSPLGIPFGETLWNLQKLMILGTFDGDFKKSQEASKVPNGFLGEFAKKKLEENQSWIDDTINDEDRELLKTSKKGPSKDDPMKDPSKDDPIELICKSYTTEEDEKTITIPPAVVLETFFDFLVRYEASKETGNREFRIRVINFGKVVQTWSWGISQDAVNKYLAKIRDCYKNIIYPSVSYDDLREILIDAVSDDDNGWDDRVEELEKKKAEKEWNKKKNKGLVIDKVLEKYRRKATGKELSEMYKDLFKLPMSGSLKETRPEPNTETPSETKTSSNETEEKE